MPKKLNPQQVKEILAGGNFNELVGTIEDDWLDCKRAPYQLDSESQKEELAKDISAFANGDEGIILLGVRTEKDPAYLGDEVREVSPFPENIVNVEQYYSILKDWIYPGVDSIEIKWFPSNGDKTKGIVAIITPKQALPKWPFLVKKTVAPGEKVNASLFGYYERRRANAIPISVQELQTLIRDGRQSGTVHERLDRVARRLDEILENQAAIAGGIPLVKRDLLRERIGLVCGELELGPTYPTYILAAKPSQLVDVPTLFSADDAEIVRLIEQPPEIRSMGFDVGTASPAAIVEGRRRQSLIRKYKALALWPDGSLVFAVDGVEFLCWGMDREHLEINQLALIESAYLFATLSCAIYNNYTQPKPKEIEYRIGLYQMSVNNIPCRLEPGPLTHRGGTRIRVGPAEFHSAPGSTETFGIIGGELHPGVIAFQLVVQVYRWFGFSDNEIPYTERAGDKMVISPEEIRRFNP